jgi:allophanate hydrolase
MSSPTAPLPDSAALLARCAAYDAQDPAVWINRYTPAQLSARVAALPPAGPLLGLSFAVKDNIDLAGLPTTAACPGYAREAPASAAVVERLLAAGALPLGKTNLDQFATGLVGVRSPHGAPRCVFNRDYISGGSSSGSAVAVAAGLVDFALGTDTAGSGRVPAAYNGLVGLKPTRGRLSTRGVLPACRSLDCVSLFTRDIATAARVLEVAEGYDPADPFSRPAPALAPPTPARPRLGVPRPDQLDWFGDAEAPQLFAAAIARWRGLGAEIVEIDYAPFAEAARLLYEGPWTAERTVAVGDFLARHTATPEAAAGAGIDPTVAQIILGGRSASAVDAFRATHRLAQLRRDADRVLAAIDALLLPTAGTIYTVEQLRADPVRLNSNLGRTNNFMNLLDLCGIALPAGRYSFGPGFGITLAAPACSPSAPATSARPRPRSPPKHRKSASPSSAPTSPGNP